MSDLNLQLPAIDVTATAKTRTSLAVHQLFAACRFTARITEVEVQNTGEPFGPFWEEILQNALAVAALTVACIESYANELYFEGSIISPPLNAAAASELAEVIDRENIVRKYATALAFRTGKRLDLGVTAVQNVVTLIKLRNAVVHFRPEWLGEEGEHGRLSARLQHKFKPSSFLPDEQFFPRAWASGDFAAWALRTTVSFLEYFYAEAAAECPITQFKKHLKELSGYAL